MIIKHGSVFRYFVMRLFIIRNISHNDKVRLFIQFYKLNKIINSKNRSSFTLVIPAQNHFEFGTPVLPYFLFVNHLSLVDGNIRGWSDLQQTTARRQAMVEGQWTASARKISLLFKKKDLSKSWWTVLCSTIRAHKPFCVWYCLIQFRPSSVDSAVNREQ